MTREEPIADVTRALIPMLSAEPVVIYLAGYIVCHVSPATDFVSANVNVNADNGHCRLTNSRCEFSRVDLSHNDLLSAAIYISK